jgi:hypothetical protein
MRVAVLPTGHMEWLALPAALQRLFPDHEFYAVPDQTQYESIGPRRGFTTSALQGKSCPVAGRATELVANAALEALGDRHKDPADLVVVLEDLELCNEGQEEVVARYFRHAVKHHLADERVARHAKRTAQVLRDRVSFHLAVPMIESWLFADDEALRRAGVPPGRTPRLRAEMELERFETADPEYALATQALCPHTPWQEKNARPKWSGEDRRRHPKGYLQWLCLDPTSKKCTTYAEAEGGAAALRDLAWERVSEREGISYLAAMLEDLGHALGGTPFDAMKKRIAQCAAAACTSITKAPRDKLLRNL